MNTLDERLKSRVKTEDCPIPENFDLRLEAVLQTLPEKRGRRTIPRTLRTLLAAAVICALCLVSVLALSPSLRTVLDALLGSFTPYSQTVEGVSSVDRGIEVRVVSALADGKRGRVYLEVRDQTGDRLTSDMALDGLTCRAYDGETGAALVDMDLNVLGEDIGDEFTRTFHAVYPGERIGFETVALPWTILPDRVLASRPVTEEERTENRNAAQEGQGPLVLEPSQSPAELDTRLFSLSSAGFDSAGKYHIQLALAPGLDASEHLISPQLVYAGDEYRGAGLYTTQFIQNGVTYVDIRLGMEGALENWRLEGLTGYVREGTPIRGTWTLSFPLEKIPERTIALSEPLAEDFAILERVTFSALGLRVEGSTRDGEQWMADQIPATLYFRDGISVALGVSNGGGEWTWQDMDSETILADPEKYEEDVKNGLGHFENDWIFEEPLEPMDITGVSLGGQTFWFDS